VCRVTVVAIAGVLLLASTGDGLAHAHLENAVPAPASRVEIAPGEVTLDFTEPLEPELSSIEVRDAGGGRVDDGAAHVAPGDGKRLSVGLRPLRQGSYKVLWRVTSIDTHRSEGSFEFTVVSP
jgi:methionine-rich copper-binding protein CopC